MSNISFEDELSGRLSAHEFVEVLLANWFRGMPHGTSIEVAEYMLQLKGYVRGLPGMPEEMAGVDRAYNEALSNLLDKALDRERTLRAK